MDQTETQIIEKVVRRLGIAPSQMAGIGDDCAAWDPDSQQLVTTDTLVDSVHFDTAFCDPDDIGWKSLAVSLSDVAAMGGEPLFYLLNVALPERLRPEWVDQYIDGVSEVIDCAVPGDIEFGAAGGDTTSGPTITCASTVIGRPAGAEPVWRHRARPGNLVFVTGRVGESAAGLEAVTSEAIDESQFPGLVEAYRRPKPRVRAGRMIGQSGLANALIDVSDGVARDSQRIAVASEVEIRLFADQLPASDQLREYGAKTDCSIFELQISGGEDFELLGTARPEALSQLRDRLSELDVPICEIGEIVEGPSRVHCYTRRGGRPIELERLGYAHFSGE